MPAALPHANVLPSLTAQGLFSAAVQNNMHDWLLQSCATPNAQEEVTSFGHILKSASVVISHVALSLVLHNVVSASPCRSLSSISVAPGSALSLNSSVWTSKQITRISHLGSAVCQSLARQPKYGPPVGTAS